MLAIVVPNDHCDFFFSFFAFEFWFRAIQMPEGPLHAARWDAFGPPPIEVGRSGRSRRFFSHHHPCSAASHGLGGASSRSGETVEGSHWVVGRRSEFRPSRSNCEVAVYLIQHQKIANDQYR